MRRGSSPCQERTRTDTSPRCTGGTCSGGKVLGCVQIVSRQTRVSLIYYASCLNNARRRGAHLKGTVMHPRACVNTSNVVLPNHCPSGGYGQYVPPPLWFLGNASTHIQTPLDRRRASRELRMPREFSTFADASEYPAGTHHTVA